MYILFFPPPPCHLMYNNVVNMYKVWMRACVCVDRTAARITGFHELVVWRKRNTYNRLFFFPLLRAQNKRRALRKKKKQEPVCHARDLGERVSSLTSNCAGDVRQSSGCVRTHIHEQKVSLSLCTGSLHPLGIVAYYLLYALSSINSATNPSTNSTTSSSFFFFFKLPEALFRRHFSCFTSSLFRRLEKKNHGLYPAIGDGM